MPRPLRPALLFLVFRAVTFAQTWPSASEPSSIAAKALVQDEAAGFLGVDTCQSCHKAEYQQFLKTPHASLSVGRNLPMNCETCHGPGKRHVDGMQASQGDDAKIL